MPKSETPVSSLKERHLGRTVPCAEAVIMLGKLFSTTQRERTLKFPAIPLNRTRRDPELIAAMFSVVTDTRRNI